MKRSPDPSRITPARMAVAASFGLPLVLAVSWSGPPLVSGASGCGTCGARVESVTVTPPTPCLTVSPSVCNLGGEVVQLENNCAAALSLTSGDLIASGAAPGDAAAFGVLAVPAGGTLEAVASPAATGATVLTMSGTLGSAPILVSIVLTTGADAAVVVEASADASDARADARDASRPVVDAGHPAADASDASVRSDAPSDARLDALRDGPLDSAPLDASGDALPE